MTDYILTIAYPPGLSATEDRVQAVLFLSGCLGSTIDEREGRTVVECYFAGPAEREAAAEMLRGDDLDLSATERPRVDWLQLYKQSLVPIPAGRRFVIVPDPSIATDPDRIRLVIPQERAFGTGSHESTALCIELLEELEMRGKRCLDVGTGTGILAIALSKLGAGRVVACDNDFDTFGIVQRNLLRNALPAGSIGLFYGELHALRSRFEVVVMNIIPEVIGPLLPVVRKALTSQGRLIVSGITLDRRDEMVKRAAAEGMSVDRELRKGEWWAAQLRPVES